MSWMLHSLPLVSKPGGKEAIDLTHLMVSMPSFGCVPQLLPGNILRVVDGYFKVTAILEESQPFFVLQSVHTVNNR